MFKKIEESQTLLINTQSKQLISQQKDIIKFGFGQSPFLPPKKVMEALQSEVDAKEYSSVQGDEALRHHIVAFHKMHNGLKTLSENVLVASGSKTLLFNILMAFEKADVFLPAPAWVSYAPQAKLAEHHIIKLPTSFEKRWRIDADSIQQAIKQKQYATTVLILNYPGNPDGLTYTEAELQALAEVFRKENIIVISDEIYGLLNHDKNHKSLANYYPEKTITTTGLSKWCGAGGWRLGVAFLPPEMGEDFKKAMIGIGSETYSCAPTPVQKAARVAYQDFDKIQDYLDWQINMLQQIGNYCANTLNDFDIQVHKPEGGFYLFPDFSPYREALNAKGIHTAQVLCQKILEETGVAMLPTEAFGFEADVLATRLAYVDFSPPSMDEDFDLEKHAPKVKRGIEALTKWVKSL